MSEKPKISLISLCNRLTIQPDRTVLFRKTIHLAILSCRTLCSVGKRSGHIPYRDSKLTRILQHSLGGNARTAIICTLSPATSHVEQSRNTLHFATRAKEVTNNAQVNMVLINSFLLSFFVGTFYCYLNMNLIPEIFTPKILLGRFR